jgi:hypothetical protein
MTLSENALWNEADYRIVRLESVPSITPAGPCYSLSYIRLCGRGISLLLAEKRKRDSVNVGAKEGEKCGAPGEQ